MLYSYMFELYTLYKVKLTKLYATLDLKTFQCLKSKQCNCFAVHLYHTSGRTHRTNNMQAGHMLDPRV